MSDIPYDDATGTMELAEALARRVVDFMKELNITSIRDSGFALADCLASADRFPHDGAFGNSPGKPGNKEIVEFIEYSYNIY